MRNLLKSKYIVFSLLVILVALLIAGSLLQEKPVLEATFVFIFIALIALFSLTIAGQAPIKSRYTYRFNRRAPPAS